MLFLPTLHSITPFLVIISSVFLADLVSLQVFPSTFLYFFLFYFLPFVLCLLFFFAILSACACYSFNLRCVGCLFSLHPSPFFSAHLTFFAPLLPIVFHINQSRHASTIKPASAASQTSPFKNDPSFCGKKFIAPWQHIDFPIILQLRHFLAFFAVEDSPGKTRSWTYSEAAKQNTPKKQPTRSHFAFVRVSVGILVLRSFCLCCAWWSEILQIPPSLSFFLVSYTHKGVRACFPPVCGGRAQIVI